MNPRLQAGVELVLEKMAAEQQASSLSGVLTQKYADTLESNVVKEDKGKANGNSEAGKNDQASEPTIEGGDDISGLTISSDKGNAKTAAQESPLLQIVRQALEKRAADPEATLGTRAGDTTQTDELEPAKSVVKNPTAGGGAGASKSNQNPLISGDSGGLNTKTGPKDKDAMSYKSATAFKIAYASRDMSPDDNAAEPSEEEGMTYEKPKSYTPKSEMPREKLASVNRSLMKNMLAKRIYG